MTASAATAAFAASPVAMAVLTGDGTIEALNAAAEQALNVSAAASRGRAIDGYVAVPADARAFAAQGQSYSAYRVTLDFPRRRPALADLHLTALDDDSGRVLLSLHFAPELPGQDARVPSRAAIGAAAMLAHEIKNPLAGIRGAAQLLRGDGPEDAGLSTLICAEVDRIVRLIDGMERFTHASASQRAAHNVHAVIDHAVALARAAHRDALHVDALFDPSLPPVLIDGDALVQVLLNLLTNAVEARDRTVARVRIETRFRHGVTLTERDGGRHAVPIELAVADDGPGAPPELVEQLFDPFVTSKTAGRGLGLALVDKLVRENGGSIRYAREGVPPTTVFRLLLPRA